MRFEEVYDRWSEHRLTQQEAADLLGVCERQFRRQCRRYEGEGIDGLIDLRLGQVSSKRAPVPASASGIRPMSTPARRS